MQRNFILPILFSVLFAAQSPAQSYLGQKGGFEGSDVVVDNVNTFATTGQRGKWSKANATQSIILQQAVVRSGNNALQATNSSTTGRRIYSPTFNPTSGQRLVLQYYRRVSSVTNTQESQAEISRNGNTSLTTAQGSYTVPSTAGIWEKVVFEPTATDYAASTWTAILHRKAGNGDNLYIDDIAVYSASSVDNTAPNAVVGASISANITNPATDLNISWNAPAGGLDGGGYLVVRYEEAPNADNDPNVNGIYAQDNSITNGTGSLRGTIVYVGNQNAIISSGLAYGTTYYYKIYTFDKAYNYSNEVVVSAATAGSRYYSKPTGSLASLSTWGTNSDGSGASPVSFSTNYQQFVLQNRTATTLDADWNVSGTGSTVIIGNGVAATELTLPEAIQFAGVLSVSDNATLTSLKPEPLAFADISPGSTVRYGYSGSEVQVITTAAYGNLVLSGASIKNPAADLIIKGNVTVTDNATLDAPGFIFTLGGDWLVNNGASYEDGGDTRGAVVFTGKVVHQLTTQGGETFSNIKVLDSGNVVLNSDVAVDSSLNLAEGHLFINNNTLQLNGAFRGSTQNSLTGSKNANLQLGSNFLKGTIYFDGSTSTSNYLNSFVVNTNDTVFVGNQLKIAPSTYAASGTTGFVKVTSGVLATNNNLTLTSDMTGTARIATGDASGEYIVGDVATQYFVPAHKAWYLLTSPLRDFDVTINQAWQEGHTFPNFPTASETPAAGTFITGGLNNYPDAVSAQDAGFDFAATAGKDASIRIWEGGNFNGSIPDGPVATALKAYQAYLLYVRGDRTIDLNNANAAPTSTVLRAMGPVASGDQGGVELAEPFSLVGNPFPSPVDFEKLYTSNSGIENRFWRWDDSLNSSGAFRLVQRNGANNYFSVPYAFTGQSAIQQHIPSGEAFFVKPTTIPGTFLEIHEADKSDSLNTNEYSATAQTIFASLYKVGAIDTLADGVAGLFSPSYNLNIDAADAMKPSNMRENVYLRRSGEMLALEAHPLVNVADTLFMGISNLNPGSYKFMVGTESFINSGLIALLEDSYTHTKTPLALDGSTVSYTFSVNGDAASYAENRFMITFAGMQVLPLNITSISAHPQNGTVSVEWNVSNEAGTSRYEVERSATGSSFDKRTNVAALNRPNGGASYTWVDALPLQGYNYYRVRSISITGEIRYSSIVRVSLNGNDKQLVSVFPNPIKGNMLTLQLNLKQGSYTARLINAGGQAVFSTSVTHQGGSATRSLNIGSLPRGVYTLQLLGGATIVSKKVIVE